MNRRNPDRTRRAIVAAARREFAEHGPAGARVDRIAAAAGVNKRMLYHYFGSKDGLWEALLAEQFGGAGAAVPTGAESLLERLSAESRRVAEGPEVTRLLAWEALTQGLDEIIAGSDRTRVWQDRVLQLQDAQRSGRVSPRFDAAQLELALTAVAVFPFVFPQLARMITGRPIADPAFARDQAAFFEVLAELLNPAPPLATTAPPKKPRFRLTATVTEL